ncbi:hypothetical protein NMB0306 [Neisseria meningitidis MC58]|jgi:hypothetical protein|uniref:Uncharacterized protein n=2 Tax=Neisseria meningitidis serogroup B TaxID=491 RepID=Q9K170_NEIMB|nr:hypothetical protein NMB0306 [Neisseria meningitidis MC58]
MLLQRSLLVYEILPDVKAESAAGVFCTGLSWKWENGCSVQVCPNEWRVLFLSICFFLFEIKFLK